MRHCPPKNCPTDGRNQRESKGSVAPTNPLHTVCAEPAPGQKAQGLLRAFPVLSARTESPAVLTAQNTAAS